MKLVQQTKWSKRKPHLWIKCPIGSPLRVCCRASLNASANHWRWANVVVFLSQWTVHIQRPQTFPCISRSPCPPFFLCRHDLNGVSAALNSFLKPLLPSVLTSYVDGFNPKVQWLRPRPPSSDGHLLNCWKVNVSIFLSLRLYRVTRQLESYIRLQSIWGAPSACGLLL